MTAIYNEVDPYAAQWTRNLIAAGHVAPGVVDERSIADLRADDVAGPGQRHFFSGIAVWSYALRLAGVADDADIWTGSCPCQPFSGAGRKGGLADKRHLWPEWFRLINWCRPPLIFGEQVASGAVVGPAVTDEDVPEVRDREAVLGLLREFEGRSPLDLYRLHEGELEEAEAFRSREDQCSAEALAGHTPRTRIGKRRSASSQVSRSRVQSRSGQYPESSRRRSVRVDRNLVQPGVSTFVERTVAGPDQLDARLHDSKHESGAVRGERDGKHVGRGENPGGRRRHPGSPTLSLCGLLDQARRETDGTDRRAWIDVVRSDLESIGYTVGVAVLPAASVGAPHIRQRLYFVAYADGARRQGRTSHDGVSLGSTRGRGRSADGREPLKLGDPGCARGGWHTGGDDRAHAASSGARPLDRGVGDEPGATSSDGGMGYPTEPRLGESKDAGTHRRTASGRAWLLEPQRTGATHDPWSDCDWIPCSDGKSRPTEPGIAPLVNGPAKGVGGVRTLRAPKLRGYGNAIVAEQAAAFIRAAMTEAA